MRYVVIDFEAACDDPRNPDPQEIVEFPAVLLDAEDPANQTAFHVFVRPVAHPRLTPFCRDLLWDGLASRPPNPGNSTGGGCGPRPWDSSAPVALTS
jgi:hypothetical protein